MGLCCVSNVGKQKNVGRTDLDDEKLNVKVEIGLVDERFLMEKSLVYEVEHGRRSL
jgi:hypothetical protein